jgi:NTP pyrophosphatase (non-canonical NTP hydrolase)
MQIREYQQWLEAWDRARGWDRLALSHTLIHALEELGEVARLVLQWEGYKEPGDPAKLAADIEEELSDVFVFLFKLAYQTGIDVEAALARGQAKADGRHFDIEKAAAELERYHRRQEAILREMVGGPTVNEHPE